MEREAAGGEAAERADDGAGGIGQRAAGQLVGGRRSGRHRAAGGEAAERKAAATGGEATERKAAERKAAGGEAAGGRGGEAAGGRHKAGHYTKTGGELLHFEPSPGWGRVLCALSAQRGWGYLMKQASMTLRSLPSEGLMVCLPLTSMQLEPPPSRLSASVQPAALSSWPTCAVVMPAMPSVI